jgi:membrane-associated phospholipid phosphatase
MPAPAAPVGHSPGDRLRRLWADRLEPNSYLGLHLTVSLVGIALCVWVFGALLDAVLDNDLVVRWDAAIDLAIHQHMTPPSLRVVDVVTQLGSPVAMVLLGFVVAIILWRRGQRTVCWGWLAAFAGGAALDEVFKVLVHRSRPVYGAAYLHGLTYSFPSGHATGSLIGYGMLAWLVRHVWHARPLARRLALAAAVLVIMAIGASRILLGVHYPSDVIGGWAIGLAWMGVCIAGIRIAQQRHMDRSHLAGADASATVLQR